MGKCVKQISHVKRIHQTNWKFVKRINEFVRQLKILVRQIYTLVKQTPKFIKRIDVKLISVKRFFAIVKQIQIVKRIPIRWTNLWCQTDLHIVFWSFWIRSTCLTGHSAANVRLLLMDSMPNIVLRKEIKWIIRLTFPTAHGTAEPWGRRRKGRKSLTQPVSDQTI